MDGIDYNELFGIDADASGANEETAAESPADSMEGANDQTIAESDGGYTEESKAGGQSAEDNARYAAARRQAQAERDAAIAAKDAEIAKLRADMEQRERDIYTSAGMVNPYTKEPIRTRADFDAYKARYDKEQIDKMQRASGMDEKAFGAMVDNLPQMREAKAQQAEAQRIIESNRMREAELAARQGIEKIQQYDPSIRSIEDLTKMDGYDRFYGYVKQGLNFEDAYLLTHREAVTQKSDAAARQAAYNSQSKAHMQSTATRGRAAAEIPAKVLEQYRALNPDASMDEIRAHWNRHK